MHAVIDRCPWSIRVHVHADTWMTSWENCFLVLLNMAHRFEHVCLIISDLEGESKEKIYQELETKRVLDHVENVYKLQEIFTTVKLWSLCHCCERLAVSKKCFRTLFCFEQQKTSKTLRSNCTQVRWRKKKKQRRQVYITWDLKNA